MPDRKILEPALRVAGGGSEESLNRNSSCETNYAMKPPRARRVVRSLIVLLTISAWFVASDHCALAGTLLRSTAAAAPAQESCPGHSQPKKEEKQSKLPCCKTLVATSAPAKIAGGYQADLFVIQPFQNAEFDFVLKHFALSALELDTGPPASLSFAESVLQRSLHAHAPPCLS